MSSESTSRIFEILNDVATPSLDPSVFSAYFAALLADDPRVESILPVIVSAVGMDNANAVASRILAAFTGPSRFDVPPCTSGDLPATTLPHTTENYEVVQSGGNNEHLAHENETNEPSDAAVSLSNLPAPCNVTKATRSSGLRSRKRIVPVVMTPVTPVRAPCRHYIAGACLRSDCAFSHDTQSIPCRYWASPSGCQAGVDCAFLHTISDDHDASAHDVRDEHHAGVADSRDCRVDDSTPSTWNLARAARWVRGDGDGADASHSIFSERYTADDGGDCDAIAWVLERLQQLENGTSVEHGDYVGDDDNSDTLSISDGEVSANLALNDAAMFPPLSQSSARERALRVPTETAGNAFTGKMMTTIVAPGDSIATRLALGMLRAAYPTLQASARRDAYLESGCDVGSAAMRLSRDFAIAPVAGALSASSQPPSKRLPSHRRFPVGTEARTHDRGSAMHRAVARRIASSLAWVTTGTTVSALYSSARREATALAKARNLAFHRSTQAYLAGNGAMAARFARQGRQLDAEMRRAHVTAASRIFTERNALRATGSSALGSASPVTTIDVSGTGAPSPARVHVLDLHGLHPGEASSAVLEVVESLFSAGEDTDIWVAAVVGTRHHSEMLGKGGGSVHDAVLQALHDGSWEAYEPPADASPAVDASASAFGCAANGAARRSTGSARTPSGVIVVRVHAY